MDTAEYNQALKPGLIQAVRNYQMTFPEEADHTQAVLRFIEGHVNLFGRDSVEGHITCSAWVLNVAADHAAMVFHRRLARWVQPGGHVEAFETPLQCALREAIEETGIADLQVLDEALFNVAVLSFPEGKDGPAHRHYDLRFLIQAPSGAVVTAGHESDGAAWIPLDRLADFSIEDTILAMAEKTAQWLRSHAARR